ncbi:MAG: hypothetical protein ACYCZX_13580 [Rhodospirillaceae bacterium]
MFRFADAIPEKPVPVDRAAPPPALLTLSQILARVEMRLRWYGFRDWRIRDAVCLGTAVTVTVRGLRGEILAFTVARDGGAMTCAAGLPAPLLKPVAQISVKEGPIKQAAAPGLARTLGKRAIGALSQWGPRGRFLSRPVLCEG